MTERLKKRKGFGLVEVIISSTIIVIILGALVFMARSILDNAGYAAKKYQAISIAQGELEKIRQMRDTNYIDGGQVSGTKWNSFVGGTTAPLAGIYYLINPKNTPAKLYSTYGLVPIAAEDREAPNKFRVSTYNNVPYYSRVSFDPILSGSGKILNSPVIMKNSIPLSPIPAYNVKVEVFWFYQQEAMAAGGFDFNKMKKIEINELITDNRPGY